MKDTTIKSVEVMQLRWREEDPRVRASAWVIIKTEGGLVGYGEASPMKGGEASMLVIERDLAPTLIGADALDQAVLYDTMLHDCMKLGPEGIVAAALAAVDIALWDIKGKALDLPIYKLLGGAWRTEMPLYSSVGGAHGKTVEQTMDMVERRWKAEQPSAIKLRLDGNRRLQDHDVENDIAKIRAMRKLVGDDMPLAFDANNQYSVGTAIRVGRILEDLGYVWFEEPVQHYNMQALGEVATKLDVTVSAGEQTYTLQGLKQLIDAGVRMVQPDIVKMGGITGMMQCAALCTATGVEFVPHQTQPAIGNVANLHVLATLLHMTKPAEFADDSDRMTIGFHNLPVPRNGTFTLPEGPGLGLEINLEEVEKRRVRV